MAIVADILLIAGALGLAFYCTVLSRRLARFTDLENGVGGAVAVLSVQVDDMTKTLKNAQDAALSSSSSLVEMTERAETVAGRLELLVASLHDLPIDSDLDPKKRQEPQEIETPPVFRAGMASRDPVFVRHKGRVEQAAL